MANSLKEILIGVLQRDFVSNEILANRKKECEKCEYNSLGQCLQCDCILHFKQKFKNEQCPMGHW